MKNKSRTSRTKIRYSPNSVIQKKQSEWKDKQNKLRNQNRIQPVYLKQ